MLQEMLFLVSGSVLLKIFLISSLNVAHVLPNFVPLRNNYECYKNYSKVFLWILSHGTKCWGNYKHVNSIHSLCAFFLKPKSFLTRWSGKRFKLQRMSGFLLATKGPLWVLLTVCISFGSFQPAVAYSKKNVTTTNTFW